MLLVVVLGFWGAQESNLVRYRDLYLSRAAAAGEEIVTVLHVAPQYQLLFLPVGGMIFEAWRVRQRMEEAVAGRKGGDDDDGELRILFHVLSNNGCLLLLGLHRLLLWERHPFHKAVKGVIFDSCPGSFSVHLLRDAIIANKPPKWVSYTIYYGPFLTLLGYLAAALLRGKHALFRAISGLAIIFVLHEIGSNAFKYLYLYQVSQCFPGAASLFLYSKKDALVHADVVERSIKQRTLAQPDSVVESRKWEFSDHVAHFKTQPEEYKEKVFAFIDSNILN